MCCVVLCWGSLWCYIFTASFRGHSLICNLFYCHICFLLFVVCLVRYGKGYWPVMQCDALSSFHTDSSSSPTAAVGVDGIMTDIFLIESRRYFSCRIFACALALSPRSFKALVAEASAEETKAKEESDAFAEAQAQERRKAAAEKAKNEAGKKFSRFSRKVLSCTRACSGVVCACLVGCHVVLVVRVTFTR